MIGDTKLFSISTLNSITIPEIECYEYVGYIISTVETTTVQSITSETVTTEGPTTEETTTEETTEETTEQEQTESEEEVTVKPGPPSSA